MPRKKIFGNTDRQFLVERQQGLQIFIDKIQEEPVLRNHLAFKKFVDPANYSIDFYGVCESWVGMNFYLSIMLLFL